MAGHSAKPATSARDVLAVVGLLVAAIGAQVAAEGKYSSWPGSQNVLWVRSTEMMPRLALALDPLLADIYWIRAVQHYGSTSLSNDPDKRFDLLYPLLDMTTTLDPDFKIAYRFGAILLSQPYPGGPGRPDLALTLLEKGIRHAPDRWEYYHDAGFVEYWWGQDPEKAAEWLVRASNVPGAPPWLPPVAAAFLAEGGARQGGRQMWAQLAESDQAWLRRAAERGLLQLEAQDAIDQLQAIVTRFTAAGGRVPRTWEELVRAGWLRFVPRDPTGEPYALDPTSGAVDVARSSSLFPMPRLRAPQ